MDTLIYALLSKKISEITVDVDKKLIADVEFSYDSTSGELGIILKNDAGETVAETSIDLPIEKIVEHAYYDADTKELVFELVGGDIVRVPVGDLIADLKQDLDEHIADTDNPHAVTKSQVGLGNVDNTSDLNKPISNATQTALNGKQATISDLQIIREGAALGATALQAVPAEYITETELAAYHDDTKQDVITDATAADIRKLFEKLHKGDIIHFDALGNGTQKRFRVLNVDGTNVKLLGLDDLGNSQFNSSDRKIAFDNGNSYQNYTDSALDSYLNTTYYNSLSATVKAAIIDETLVQSCWQYGSSSYGSDDFIINRPDGSLRYYKRITQRTIGLRHIHALDVDEVAAYLGAGGGNTVLGADLLEMYFEQRTTLSKYVWCASASAVYSSRAFIVSGDYGSLYYNLYDRSNVVRPAFKINLSTIEYTKE